MKDDDDPGPRTRTLQENMESLLNYTWCGNATGWLHDMSPKDQEQLLAKLSPDLAAKWREVLGLPAIGIVG